MIGFIVRTRLHRLVALVKWKGSLCEAGVPQQVRQVKLMKVVQKKPRFPFGVPAKRLGIFVVPII